MEIWHFWAQIGHRCDVTYTKFHNEVFFHVCRHSSREDTNSTGNRWFSGLSVPRLPGKKPALVGSAAEEKQLSPLVVSVVRVKGKQAASTCRVCGLKGNNCAVLVICVLRTTADNPTPGHGCHIHT